MDIFLGGALSERPLSFKQYAPEFESSDFLTLT